MWKDYSWSYIKNNRASSISVMVAAFISALFLSLLCTLFYNFWKYDIERIEIEEGSWQARIEGELDNSVLDVVEKYPNIDKVIINKELSDGQNIVADLYFNDMRRILEDLPQIAELTGIDPEAITCHHSLLSMYLIRDPKDPAPRLVFPFFLAITGLACFSLIMIIHNSFAVSMNARIHQFGIFSSIGATPRQIRACLLQEAAALCAVPLLLGNVLGVLIGLGVMEMTNIIAGSDISGRHEAVGGYHPLVFVFTFAITILTVWISAWYPARKLSRLTPLEAIRNTGEIQLKKRKNSRVLAFFFGLEGELAGNSLKAQKKAWRTATLSLTFSFLAFTLMQCFFTLSGISTRMTYFERYQDVWDVMVTVKDTGIEAFHETEKLQEISGVRNLTVYQKAEAKRMITEEEVSEEFSGLGGFQNADADSVSTVDGGWLVNAPLVILDDASFLAYCRQIKAEPRLDGAVILNQIRDTSNPNFRDPDYYPYLEETINTTVLQQSEEEKMSAEIPVISYTQEVPALREEYGTTDYYELVHFLPASLWEQLKDTIKGVEEDSYIRVLAREGVTLEELKDLEKEVTGLIGNAYEIESENRIQDKIANDKMVDGMMLVLGGFCVLFAIIGIGNVFSNTLGFVRQRRREFARYMSVGLTPGGIKKMFCIEALVIAGRPVLVTLPLTVVLVAAMLKASYLEPMIFIKEAPFMPVIVFLLAIIGFVALAYYLGGRKILRHQLADALLDDTMI